MILSELKFKSKLIKRRKRVGRGNASGKGKTSGRGAGGDNSRSGRLSRPQFSGGQMPLFRRLPKRGFNNARFRRSFVVVNVRDLARFEAGQIVGPEQLKSAGLVKKLGEEIKILGDGTIDVALTVQAHSFSKSAAEKITAAGGKAELVE